MRNEPEKRWNKVYSKHKSYGESLSRMLNLAKNFKKNQTCKILDLGCGSGRHVIFLAQKKFDVYGLDISKKAISIAKRNLLEKKLKATLRVGTMSKTPYRNNFFDAVISFRVINHGTIKEIDKTISEIKRVLRPGGLVFINFQKILIKKNIKYRKINGLRVKMINSRTYSPLEGPEAGIIHYIFNKKILREKFKAFEVYNIGIDYGKEKWQRYYYLLGRLKY